uniref:Carrier domain-containing protein n=1 Tax=Haptolina brevifila TaxID=156173 RepID=A0A7S2JMB0_9EUKA
MGVAAVFDSRDPTSFSSGIHDSTTGVGVDVVLNSLAGEAAATSLKLLKPFGRFVEIGKRDAYEGGSMSLAPFLRGLTYSTAHIDVLMLEQPVAARALLETVAAALPSLPHLPATVYPMADLNEALSYMGSGKHIGKVLIRTSAVDASDTLPAACGAPNDPLFRSLLPVLRRGCNANDTEQAARHSGGMLCDGGRCVVLRDASGLEDAELERQLRGAAVVITRCPLVATWATTLGAELALELRGGWGPLSSRVLREAMRHRGSGHVVASEPAESEMAEVSGAASWLPALVADVAGVPSVDLHASFDDYGLDSLLLINLAQRISTKLGRRLAVSSIQQHDNVANLLEALAPSLSTPPVNQKQLRVLCLHGFRASADLMRIQMAPLLGAIPEVLAKRCTFVFVDAQRPSTGPAMEGIPPEIPTFEWWGEPGPYDETWKRGFDGFGAALHDLMADGPYDGIIGFSQGGAVASLIPARWVMLFSTITPPTPAELEAVGAPKLDMLYQQRSFHTFDEEEEYAALCKDMVSRFNETTTVLHTEGHAVPKTDATLSQARMFLEERLAEG